MKKKISKRKSLNYKIKELRKKKPGKRSGVHCYLDKNKKYSRYLMTAFASSCKEYSYIHLIKNDGLKKEKVAFYKGLTCTFGRKTIPIVKRALEEKRSFLYFDHAYFNRAYKKESKSAPFFRIIKNNIHPDYLLDVGSDRFDKLDIKVKNWRKDGGKILICPPSSNLTYLLGKYDNWLDSVIPIIYSNTDRKIIIRLKSQNIDIEPYLNFIKKYKNIEIEIPGKTRPREQDFKDVWAVVAPASNFSIEAAINGIPSFCEKESPANFFSLNDYSKIEEPIYPDIRKYLYSLSYCQFNLNEISSGKALGILREFHPKIFSFMK